MLLTAEIFQLPVAKEERLGKMLLLLAEGRSPPELVIKRHQH